jgi:serine phosphatase RsbU (regulator of sigma subunit)
MRVGFFHSLSTKLFIYMSSLILITLVGNSYQFLNFFQKHQTESVLSELVLSTEQASRSLSQNIEGWVGQLVGFTSSLAKLDNNNGRIQGFLANLNEFEALYIFQKVRNRFQMASFSEKSQNPQARTLIPQALDGLSKQSVNQPGRSHWVMGLGKTLKAAELLLAVRIQSNRGEIWIAARVSQKEVLKYLPQSEFVSSRLVDDQGIVLASFDIPSVLSGLSLKDNNLFKTMRIEQFPSGVKEQYQDEFKKSKIGAYSSINTLGLHVLVERDASEAFEIVRKNILSTALWAILFLVLAVFFSLVGAAQITSGLRLVTQATQRIASGDFKFKIPLKTPDEVGLLSASVNHMSHQIVHLLHSQVETARFEKELETARMVQSAFFPKEAITIKDMKISGFYHPASECGGDLWGHYNIGDGKDLVFVADATGHGAPAALVTAIAYSTSMAIADMIKGSESFENLPSMMLSRINRIIYESVRGTIWMTFFIALIDTKKGKIIYANAGHNHPMLWPAKVDDPRIKARPKFLKKVTDQAPVMLAAQGAPLGGDPTTVYEEHEMDIVAGDRIFMFSDGLIECTSPTGEFWNNKQLLKELGAIIRLDADQLTQSIYKSAFDFYGTHPLKDDVTVVCVQIEDSWQKEESDDLRVNQKVVEVDDKDQNFDLPEEPFEFKIA